MVIRQYGVFLVNLDPTLGHEMQKTRPCLVVSSDEMNKHIPRHGRAPARG